MVEERAARLKEKMRKRLAEKNLKLELSDGAKDLIIEKGSSLEFGARPLRRAIEHLLEDPLAEQLLRGDFQGKEVIKVVVSEKSEKGEDKETEEKKLAFEATGSTAPELATAIKAGKE